MTDLVVHPQHAPMRGIVSVPSDKSITHRALLFASLARGDSRIVSMKMGDDNRSTLAALRLLGVELGIVEVEGTPKAPGRHEEVLVKGRGLAGLVGPSAVIDCGNSGTTMRLLAGILAAQRFKCVLVGDASLSRRPMARIASPLRLRGARIEGRLDPRKIGEITAPLEIGPLPEPHLLSGITYDAPIASAQVKSAVLLSGLYSDGSTIVSEPTISRDHTERMLSTLGVPIMRVGSVVELDAGRFSGELPAFEIRVPGDLSSAAFLLAAALVVPGSEVGVRTISANPTRAGVVEVMRAMGGAVELTPHDEQVGEPVGDVFAAHRELRGAMIAGEVVTRAIDEIPVLLALAARAKGTTTVHDASELRVKESDRIASMACVLRAFGVACEERADGIEVEGRPEGRLTAATVSSDGDHRVAMSAAILGLAADGPTRIRDVDCIATSFPRFVGTLRALGANIEVVS